MDSTTIQEHIDKLTTTQNVISQMLEDYNNLSRFYPLTHTTIPAEFDTTSLINKSAYCDQLQHDYNKYQVNHKLLEIELPQEQQFNIEPNIYIKDYNEYNNLYQQIAQYNQQLQDLQNQETVLNEQLKQIINKAYDAGYRFVIVLSGIHNSLRSQTQSRIDEEVLGYFYAQRQTKTADYRPWAMPWTA